jgi:NitT/TauT family transport system substrate-binding protein
LGLSAAGLALLDACGGSPAAQGAGEGTLETTTIRISSPPPFSTLCLTPQYLAKDLLHSEGFTDIQYAALLSTTDVAASEDEVIAGNADIALSAPRS